MAWEAGEVTAASLRLVASDGGNGGGGRMAQCRVLSRTPLLIHKGGGEGVGWNLPGDEHNDGVYEGGLFWYSVHVEALRVGEEARLLPVGSRG